MAAGIRRDGAFVQRQRIHQIAKDLELKLTQNQGIISLKEFQAYCQWEYGLNPKTTRKYLETLETLKKIKVDDKADRLSEFYDINNPEKDSEGV